MMKKFAGVALAGLLMLVAETAGAQAPVDSKADTQKLANAWMQAYNNKDAATVAKMYADDVVFSNPGWTASGRAAIEEGLKKDIAAGVFKVNTITVDQSHRVGDMNYAWGGWTADMKTPDGKEVPVQGGPQRVRA
jgi:uncharacterized protein (TIGR02246 family)